MNDRRRPSWRILLVIGAVLGLAPEARAQLVNVSPTQSTLHSTNPNGASGGRVGGLASVPGDNTVYYAASEWGGLFKSVDAGFTWVHLPGHVPTATWAIKVDPSNTKRVFATSFYDGRVKSQAGISVSTDGGATWKRPASATPEAGFCLSEARRNEPSAFGIAIDPDNPKNVYVGTNCGLAISKDSGATWKFVDPTLDDKAGNIWGVVVRHKGIIDICGDDGHLRSIDGGGVWTEPTGAPLPTGRCSIAASPDEPHVLFAIVGMSTIFESNDGGQSWPVTYENPSPQGRIPFVEVNDRTGPAYDLWFGDIRLWRATCSTPSPAGPGGSPRCTPSDTWAGPFTRTAGAHDDAGSIVFDTNEKIDRCPRIFSSDGGVFVNTKTASPDCHTPVWTQPKITPTALWLFTMAGVRRPGATDEDLYLGNQDNGSFGTTNAGAPTPKWTNQKCCDGFDTAGELNRVLTTICCTTPPPRTRLYLSSPGLSGPPVLVKPPPGLLPEFKQLGGIASIGKDKAYVVLTSSGVYLTTDITAADVTWTQLGVGSSPLMACGVQVIRQGDTIILVVKNEGCNGDQPGALFLYKGIDPDGTWTAIPGASKAGVFAVDPANSNRIIIADLSAATPAMKMTSNGGTDWSAMPDLDKLMTSAGAFKYRTTRGPTAFTRFNGYPQPTLVAIDRKNSKNVVAGGADSGVFLSRDGGINWKLMSDPHTPGTSGRPHVPRPRYAHFDYDDASGKLTIYIGTQGRGAWRLRD